MKSGNLPAKPWRKTWKKNKQTLKNSRPFSAQVIPPQGTRVTFRVVPDGWGTHWVICFFKSQRREPRQNWTTSCWRCVSWGGQKMVKHDGRSPERSCRCQSWTAGWGSQRRQRAMGRWGLQSGGASISSQPLSLFHWNWFRLVSWIEFVSLKLVSFGFIET